MFSGHDFKASSEGDRLQSAETRAGRRLQHQSEGCFPLHHTLAPLVMNGHLEHYFRAAVLTWGVCWEPSSDAYHCRLPCVAPKVLEQTLSPLWDELLVLDLLIVDGRRARLQQEPPLVIINVFDHNKFVSVAWASPGFLPPASPLVLLPPPLAPEPLSILSSLACSLQGPPVFLGRALAAPRVKLMDDTYQRPELQFFPLRKGPRAAGELIATFELIELDYSGRLEVRVPWPSCHELWIPLVILSGCPAPGNI